MNKLLLSLSLTWACLLSMPSIEAAKKAFCIKNYKAKPPSKKAPFASFGKPSKVNKLPKTKVVSGHIKKTTKGYTYVNPYARSK
jgi:hypothetical protein